jgi:hypothetical protein
MGLEVTESAGINRHIVGDESALRKRRSDSILASSLACGRLEGTDGIITNKKMVVTPSVPARFTVTERNHGRKPGDLVSDTRMPETR